MRNLDAHFSLVRRLQTVSVRRILTFLEIYRCLLTPFELRLCFGCGGDPLLLSSHVETYGDLAQPLQKLDRARQHVN